MGGEKGEESRATPRVWSRAAGYMAVTPTEMGEERAWGGSPSSPPDVLLEMHVSQPNGAVSRQGDI